MDKQAKEKQHDFVKKTIGLAECLVKIVENDDSKTCDCLTYELFSDLSPEHLEVAKIVAARMVAALTLEGAGAPDKAEFKPDTCQLLIHLEAVSRDKKESLGKSPLPDSKECGEKETEYR